MHDTPEPSNTDYAQLAAIGVRQEEPFAITNDLAAAWALDKVLTQRERLERIKQACAEMISAALRDVEQAEARFLPAQASRAGKNLPHGKKSIKLPTGALGFRTIPAAPKVVDEAQVLAWALAELPHAVVVRETVRADLIKAYVTSTGDLPPGVEMTEARESFTVKA